jgi:hypothetical protein
MFGAWLSESDTTDTRSVVAAAIARLRMKDRDNIAI